MATLNHAQIVELARKNLEIDEKPTAVLPPFYLSAFAKHAARFPNDTNFIVEFAKPDRKGSPVGGTGFGIATCLEDYCWTDVRLGSDPDLHDGGKANGFGSLWEYQMHCDKPDHKRGREERCQKAGITFQPTAAVLGRLSQGSSGSAQAPAPVAGPSDRPLTGADRWYYGLSSDPTSQSQLSGPSSSIYSSARSQPFDTDVKPAGPLSQSLRPLAASTSSASSSILHPTSKHNLPASQGSSSTRQDIKPDLSFIRKNATAGPSRTAASKSFISLLDDDSDEEEVSVLRPEDIPEEYRRKTNKDAPFVLSDDEDDPMTSYLTSTGLRLPVSPVAPKPKALIGRSSQGATDAFEQMMLERSPRPYRMTESRRQPILEAKPYPAPPPLASRQAHPAGSQHVKPEYKPHILSPAYASSPPIPGAYPPPAPAGPSNFINPAASSHMPDMATRLRQELLKIKAVRDHQIRVEQHSVQALRPLANQLPVSPGKVKLLQDIMAYGFSLTALLVRPSAVPFPDLPATIQQHFPWFVQTSAASRARHQQYRDADIAVAAATAGMPEFSPLGASTSARTLGAYTEDDEEEERIAAAHGYEWDRPANLEDFFQSAMNDFSEDQDIDKALSTLGLTNQHQKFADMTVTLLPHQILGVAFMLEKEKDRKFRGGLLCDAMGLGKTVQTIATIAGNPSEDRRVRTTLIVAPLAVLTQWKSEIESKTAAGLFKVYIYHGPNKPKNPNLFKNVDIVLTTYGTLVSDFGEPKRKTKPKRRVQETSEAEEESEVEPPRRKGPLFRMQWYRVVLDEAHGIRNRATQASRGVAELDAIHRWSLTGTLINNKLDDIFPHLRFLGISPQAEWTEFNKHICKVVNKRPKLATNRAQAILKTCMMRRHKESTLNGVRLLQLPPKETTIEELDFTPEERLIYNQVEQRMKIKFGKFLKEGTVLKHMSCVLTMLMRLRQLTCHPWLLRRNPGDPAHPDDFEVSDEDLYSSLNIAPTEGGNDLINAIQHMGEEWVADVVKKLKERYERMINAPKRDEDAEKDNECSICLDIFTDESITSCKHSFCKACINEIFENAPRDAADISDEQAARGSRKCPLCRTVIEKAKTYAAIAFFDPEKQDEEKDEKPDVKEEPDRKGKRKSLDKDDSDYEDVKPDLKKPNNKGKGKAKAKPEPESDAEEVELDAIERVLPSTKMKMMGTLLDTYLAEDGVKIIIFSEFVSYLKLCSIYLDQKDIDHHIYHGGMRQKDREEVIRNYTAPISDNNPARVILISRKAGGAGLNLTVASKVISLDLAWNAAAENQAVDRAHRIGQTRPVDIRRLVIQDTVEQRILALQASKEALSDGAMGEGTGGRLGRLSVQDLMRLFNYDNEDV